MKLLRMPVAFERLGLGHSSGYAQIQAGLLPRAVKSGRRATSIPEHELNAVIAYRIAGKSDTELRELVQRLEADRARALDEFVTE